MNPAQPVIVRSERLSVPEVIELLESSDSEILCDLPPVKAKGGEVYIYRNEQHPGKTAFINEVQQYVTWYF